MKIFNLKRLTALILALITLTCMFASCANTPDDPATNDGTTAAPITDPYDLVDTEPAGTEAQTDEWGRPYVESPTAADTKLPNDTVITVLMRDSATWNRELYSESETGDMLNDGIYNRNLKLEEDLNFKFEFIKSPSKEDSQRTIIAEYESGGSSDLDLVMNYAY